jgi:hypothetical protein
MQENDQPTVVTAPAETPVDLPVSDIYGGLQPIEKMTIQTVVNRLNYSQLEILVRLSSDQPLSTDLTLAQGFAPELFQGEVLHPLLKGFLQQKGEAVLASKPK